MFYRCTLTVALLLSCATFLFAQGQRGPTVKEKKQSVQPVRINGTIEGVSRGMIAVTDDGGKRWRVAVPAGAKVNVTGEAEVGFLRSGLAVEFTATLNERGEAQEKVGEMTIVTTSKDRPIGMTSVGGAAGGDEDGFGAGEDGKKKKGRGSAKKKKGIEAGEYRIVGRLAVAKGGKYMVKINRATVRFELTEDAKIAVDVADFSIAAKGDKVSIEGVTPGNQPGIAKAESVRIELSEKLSGGKKKQPPKSTPKHKPRKRT